MDISIAQKYQQIIQKGINKRILILSNVSKKPKSIVKYCNQELSLSYPFKSNQQIQTGIINISNEDNYYNQLNELNKINQNPQSWIGIILSQHQENGKIFYVFGTGTLIHNNIVFTSAENIYCKRLHKQYSNIRFIPRINDNIHTGIFDVRRVYYPKQYIQMEVQAKYNFAILKLYDDLDIAYGYVGLQEVSNFHNQMIKMQGYARNMKKASFDFFKVETQCTVTKNFINFPEINIHKMTSGNPLMIVDQQSNYHLIGINNNTLDQYFGICITPEIKNIVRQWMMVMKLDLDNFNVRSDKKLGKNISELNKYDLNDLHQVHLYNNQIGVQGCIFLKNIDWIHLRYLNLGSNNITSEGCKYLKQAKWIHLRQIYLISNNIDSEGCKYLVQANWPHILNVGLGGNKINFEGCNYLRQANWIYLQWLDLGNCNIDSKCCKYLKDTKWNAIQYINLQNNIIEVDSIDALILSGQWAGAYIEY